MPYIKSKERRGRIEMSVIMSDEKILNIANEKFLLTNGRRITPSQGILYLRLIQHSLKNKIQTHNQDGFIVLLSLDEMCCEFNFGKTLINDTLKDFAKAGIIERRRLTAREKREILGENNCFGNYMVTKVLAENIFEKKESKGWQQELH